MGNQERACCSNYKSSGRAQDCRHFFSPLFKDARGAGNSIPGGRTGGQRGWCPKYRTGWTTLGMTGVLDGADVPQGPAV
jgi:hypothetical protein